MLVKNLQQKIRNYQRKTYTLGMSVYSPEAFAKWLNDSFKDSSFKSFSELADIVKLSRATVSSYASARPQTMTNKASRPKRENVIALANALNKDVNEALMLAGHAPFIQQSEVELYARKLVENMRASGFDDIEDDDLRQAVWDDARVMAEHSIKRSLAEQMRRKRKDG